MITFLILGVSALVSLYVLIVGKYSVESEKMLVGFRARLMGFVFTLSLPLVALVVILIQLYLFTQGYTLEETETNFTAVYLVLMGVTQMLILYLGLKYEKRLYLKQSANAE